MKTTLRQWYGVYLESLRTRRVWEYIQRWPEKRRLIVLSQLLGVGLFGVLYSMILYPVAPLLSSIIGWPAIQLTIASCALLMIYGRRLRRDWRAHKAEPPFPAESVSPAAGP